MSGEAKRSSGCGAYEPPQHTDFKLELQSSTTIPWHNDRPCPEPDSLLSLAAEDGFYAFLADWQFDSGQSVTFADLYAYVSGEAPRDLLFRLTLHLHRAMTLEEIFGIMDAWFAREVASRGLCTLPQSLDCVEDGIFYFTF
jgi:hypothetical protein